jgi:hypothetical protein
MHNELKGEAMSLFNYIKFDELTDEERRKLKKIINEKKKELQAAIKAADKGLKALEKKPKPKK